MDRVSLPALERNRQVKDYICTHFSEDPIPMQNALKASEKAGLKEIQVPQNVAKMLYMFTLLVRPQRILEIGTLGGYSTLWFAKALKGGGKIVTIEMEKAHAEVAENNFALAGYEDCIELRLGKAQEVLQELIDAKEEPFDLIFIDADKESYPLYLELSLKLSQSGTLILSDNLIPKRGEIGCPDPRDNEALAIYEFNQAMRDHPFLESHVFPTIVGEKGRVDGLGVSIVR
jgi:predicted O-methyltransferase YrrM